jgi:putative tricarboxylic transport membrane protein
MSRVSHHARSPSDRALPGESRAKALGHVVFNGLLALLFLYMFVRAGELPSSMWEPMGSGTFPRLILGLLIAFNLLLMAKELRNARAGQALTMRTVRDWLWQHRLAFGVLGLFALFVAAVPLLGFRWASFPFLVACQYLLGARRTKGLLIAVIVAAALSFGLDSLFRHVFTISLPRGAWG